MATSPAELQAQLEKLEAARALGILTVEYDGRRITYRSDRELAAAIGYTKRRLSAHGTGILPTCGIAGFSRD